MAFPTYRLPPEVEIGMQGGPTYWNVIQESISGQEQRVRVWAKCRGLWRCGFSILDTEETSGAFRGVIALFRAHFGSFIPFPFKDWSDYQLDDERIGTGDGVETEYQIIKTYDPSQIILNTPGSVTYVREIYLPRSGLVVEVDGTPTTDYSLGPTGLITFGSPPGTGDAVTVTGEFDVPVRFDIGPGEPLPIVVNESHIAQIEPFGIREVIGTAELA